MRNVLSDIQSLSQLHSILDIPHLRKTVKDNAKLGINKICSLEIGRMWPSLSRN